MPTVGTTPGLASPGFTFFPTTAPFSFSYPLPLTYALKLLYVLANTFSENAAPPVQ
jgi:hypothetical protein